MPDSGPRRGLRTTSRRRLLSAAAACVTLAGCARTIPDRGRTRVCGTSRVGDGGPGELIQQVDVTPGETAVLGVVLNRDAEGFDALDRLLVFGPEDERLYTVPRDSAEGPDGPRRTYQQALGPFPQNGVVRVEARDAEGSTLDAMTVEFTCYAETPTAGERSDLQPRGV